MLALFITLVATLALGWIYMVAQGGVRRTRGHHGRGPTRADLATLGLAPGCDGTLIEVTAPTCAQCESAYRVLLAAADTTIAVHRVDVADHPEVARRWQVLQAPTTFVLDAQGVAVARIAGLPTQASVDLALKGLTS